MRLVEAVESEVPEVEAHASDLAGRLKGRPRLAPEAGGRRRRGSPVCRTGPPARGRARRRAQRRRGRAGLCAWQANELPRFLGEAQAATSVAVVARWVERALGP